jgi:hypothetical protein
MDVEVFLMADAATDSQGKLNILGAFDTVFAPAMPTLLGQCAIVIRLRVYPSDTLSHNVEVHITTAEGTDLVPPASGKFDLPAVQPPAPSSGINIIFNIIGLKFERYGEHAIHLDIDGQRRNSLPLYVKVAPQPVPTPIG